MTGQERSVHFNATHMSCTIEMMDLNRRYDVAVIDEIQMIGCQSRGDSWTQALLGLQADEIHLCGDPRAHELVKALCERTGDIFEAREYKRLSTLTVEETHIASFSDLRPGDCIVAFSRQKLFEI